jgi:hypothetical protein
MPSCCSAVKAFLLSLYYVLFAAASAYMTGVRMQLTGRLITDLLTILLISVFSAAGQELTAVP